MNSSGGSNVDPSELRLVADAASGDRDARRALFEAYRDVAYRVAVRIIGRHDDALDVVQDAFIKAFERIGELEREAGFKTWLLRIVANRALDGLRARKVRLAVSIDHGDEGGVDPADDEAETAPDAGLEQDELALRLKRAVDSLPPEQKSVFSMYASGDLTYGEIAASLGIPIGTVMSRLFHARKKLSEVLPDLAPRDGGLRKAE